MSNSIWQLQYKHKITIEGLWYDERIKPKSSEKAAPVFCSLPMTSSNTLLQNTQPEVMQPEHTATQRQCAGGFVQELQISLPSTTGALIQTSKHYCSTSKFQKEFWWEISVVLNQDRQRRKLRPVSLQDWMTAATARKQIKVGNNWDTYLNMDNIFQVINSKIRNRTSLCKSQ